MLLKLSSTNTELSWILSKNPITQLNNNEPFAKPLRKGRVFGWFSNEQQFTVMFRDSPLEASFSDSEFEYLDQTRYGHPLAMLGMIDEMLKSAAEGKSELDRPDEVQTLFVPSMLFLRASGVDAFCNHVHAITTGRVAFTIKPLVASGSVNEVLLVTHGKLSLALGWLRLFCLFQLLSAANALPTSQLERYAKVLANLDAPYFLRYLFSRNALTDRKQFKAFQPILETEDIKLCYGDTRQQRFDALREYLGKTGATQLIDIGCGEGWYASKLAGTYQDILAFDLDEGEREKCARLAKRRNLENIQVLPGITPDTELELMVQEGADVLMTEVIEHMPLLDATELVSRVLHTGAGRVLVTTPNKQFNQNYLLGEDTFRHDDHDWEPTMSELLAWAEALAAATGCVVTISGIGDSVHGEHTSLLAIFTKKEQQQ